MNIRVILISSSVLFKNLYNLRIRGKSKRSTAYK